MYVKQENDSLSHYCLLDLLAEEDYLTTIMDREPKVQEFDAREREVVNWLW